MVWHRELVLGVSPSYCSRGLELSIGFSGFSTFNGYGKLSMKLKHVLFFKPVYNSY